MQRMTHASGHEDNITYVKVRFYGDLHIRGEEEGYASSKSPKNISEEYQTNEQHTTRVGFTEKKLGVRKFEKVKRQVRRTCVKYVRKQT